MNSVSYSNANYVSSPNDRKSNGVYCMCLGDSLILWQSSKQKVVSQSNVKSEYHAMALVCAELHG